MKRKLLSLFANRETALLVLLLISLNTNAQTFVFSNANGGFESGTTFAANGWTVVNPPTNTNRNWYVGTGQTGYTGNRCAFIGNSTTNVGTTTGGRTVHIYRSVSFPSNASAITLTFKYKQAVLDQTFDYVKVYLTAEVPTNSNLPAQGQIGAEYPGAAALANFTKQTILIPDSCIGKTYNLIFFFNADAITPHAYGAVDDISLFYTPLPLCTGTPNAGTALATGTACAGILANTITLSLSGATTGVAGLTYQWRVRPAGASTFTNIANATSATLVGTPIALGATYDCIVICTNSGLSSTSASVTYSPSNPPTVATLPFLESFETWISACATNERPSINWVNTVATGNNSWRRNNDGTTASWTSTSGAYSPVSTLGAASARFHSYNASNGSTGRLDVFVNCNTTYSTKEISFDYINTSGSDVLDVFVSNDYGLTYQSIVASLTTASTWTNFKIPFTSSNAITIVRLRATGDFGLTDIGVDNLNIYETNPCSGTPNPGNTLSSIAGFCPSLTINPILSLQNATTLTATTGLIYQWESSTNSITYTPISGATSISYTATGIGAEIYYRCVVTCTNSSLSANSNPFRIEAFPSPSPISVTSTPTELCAAGSATLNATGANTYTWTPTGSLSSSTIANPVATIANSTRYTVVGSDANGCTSSTTYNLFINPIVSSNITTGSSAICTGNNVPLNANGGGGKNYIAASTTFNYLTAVSPTTISFGTTDDAVSSLIYLPFNFKYFGIDQTSFYVYTNGFIRFGGNGNTNVYSSTIPSTANPDNLIAGLWDDLNTVGGTVSYFTSGTTPNQIFVVDYSGVKFYNTAANNGRVDFQIQLFEIDNHVEVHLKEVNDPVLSAHSVGLENGNGFFGAAATGRNNQTFTVLSTAPEAWKFTPDNSGITYSWSPTNGLSSSTIQNPTVQNISSPISYTVTATSNGGCTATSTINLNPQESPKPKLNYGDTTLCSPDVIFLQVVDTGAYQVSGYPTNTLVDWFGLQNNVPPSFLQPSNATNSYKATVKLPNGCVATTPTVNIQTRSIPINSTVTPLTCFGATGKIKVVITTAPLPPYRYVWTDGINVLRDTVSNNISDSLQNLGLGTYYLSIYDNYGGALSCSSLNVPFNVTQIQPLEVLINSSSNPLCNGSASGSASALANGGSLPYQYLWSNGSALSSIENLLAGTYTIVVTDKYGCTNNATVIITEPLPLTTSFNSTQPCFGQMNGSLTAIPVGGTAPYNFVWLNSSFDLLSSTSETVSGLSQGTYYVSITDSNGCNIFVSEQINDLPQITITNVAPSTINEGGILTINGTGFSSATSVSIGSSIITSFTIINDSQIVLTIGTGIISGNVSVNISNCQSNVVPITVINLISFYLDNDGDGFGNSQISILAFTNPGGYVTNSTDCNDNSLLYADADGDGFGAGSPVACGVANNTDCNDNDITVNVPLTYYRDVDVDGFGDLNNPLSVCLSIAPIGFVTNSTDCNDNSLLYLDADGDGFGAGAPAACGVANNTDCDDNNISINPSAIEVCNGVDDDCDNSIDEDFFITSLTPDSGYIGQSIVIKGFGFTGTTGVSFNGTTANIFSVLNDTIIQADVPANANDGFISVTKPICGTVQSSQSFNVLQTISAITLNVNVLIEGYYSGANTMVPALYNAGISTDPTEVDSITIQLVDPMDLLNVYKSETTVLKTNGTSQVQLTGISVGSEYYIVIRTRNGITTWSKTPVEITSNTVYDFTN